LGVALRDVSAPPDMTERMKHDNHRLVLWDIDGTLITTGAAGQRAISFATKQQFGEEANLDGVEIAGRTDLAIAHQILTKYRVSVTEDNVAAFLNLYLELLARELPRSQGHVMPGVLELLRYCEARSGVALGLLTGNLRRGAKLKLEHYGIWRFFAFGAFADDHHDRNELGAFAISRALKTTSIQFAPAQIDVIGDTGHDIACGKAFGARTIAVATGGWSREQLAEQEPDFLLNDFTSVDQVIAVLGW
jgi:phosphoglycolate phosphatase-like HAD superfamily hydrolase